MLRNSYRRLRKHRSIGAHRYMAGSTPWEGEIVTKMGDPGWIATLGYPLHKWWLSDQPDQLAYDRGGEEYEVDLMEGYRVIK